MSVVREDTVKVTFDVDDKPLEQVDSGIDKLVDNTRRLTGDGGVGGLTKGFDDAARSAQNFAKTDFAGKITQGIEEFNAKATDLKNKMSGLINAVKHPVQTATAAFSGLGKKVTSTTSKLKEMASAKITGLKTNITNIKTALTQGQTGAKGFATAVKNLGKVSINSLANGVKNLTANLKEKAVTAARNLKTSLGNLAKTSLKAVVNGVKNLGSGLKTALTSAGKLAVKLAGLTLKGLATGVAALGTAVTAAGAGIFKLTDMASDLEETQNKVSVAFGDESGKAVQEWAKSSVTNMGLAKQTALDMTALFGDMGTSMGLTQSEAADMSMNLTQLGADLASFKNMDIEETTNALNGIFTGETESLKRLGVVMSQTNLEQFAMAKGITKTMDEMTEAEKVQLRYQYVMEKTANAQGDFKRTGGGFANQLRMLKEQFKEMGTNIGSSFLPALTTGLQKLNGFATELNEIFKDGIQEDDFAKVGDVIGRALTEGMTAVQKALPGLISFVSSGLNTLAQSVLPMLPGILTTLVQGVTDIFTNLVSVIQQNSGTLVDGVIGLVKALADGVLTILPQIAVLGAQLIVQLAAGLSQQLPALVPKAVEAITTIVNGLLGAIDQLVACGLEIVQGLIAGIVENLPEIAMAAVNLLQGLADSLLANLNLIVTTAIDLIMALANGLLSNLPAIIDAAVQLVFGLVNGLIQNINLIIQGALQLILALCQGLLNCLPQVLQAAMTLVFGLVEGLLNNLNLIVQAGFNLIIGLIQGIVQMLPEILIMGVQLIIQLIMGIVQNLPLIIQAGIELIVSLATGLIQALPQLLGMIPQIFSAFIEGIFSINWLQVGWDLLKSLAVGIWEGIKSIGSSIWEGVKGLFSGDDKVQEAATSGTTIGTSYATGLSSGISTGTPQVTTSATTLSNQTSYALSGTQNTAQYGYNASANLAAGISSSSYMPVGAASATRGLIGTELSALDGTASSCGSSVASSLASGINGNSGTAVSAASSMSTQVENAASTNVTVGVVGDTSSMTGFTSQVSQLVSGSATELQGIPTAFDSSLNEAKNVTTAALDGITAAFTAGMKEIINATSQAMQSLLSGVKSGMAAVSSAVASVNLFSSGVSVMQGLNRGMQSQLPNLVATATRAAAAIKRATDVELKIHSPSKVMEESGTDAGLGQVKGLLGTIPKMEIAAQEVSNASIPYDTYSPDSGSTYLSGGNSEYTTISPQFNLTISGTADDRAMARRVKRYVSEAISETFESMERKSFSRREA